MNKPRKHGSYITLIGLFADPENGILVCRNDDGVYQLPEKKIWRSNSHCYAERQIIAECDMVARTVFEKTGLSLDVRDYDGSFYLQFKNKKTGTTKLYKVFVLVQLCTPPDKDWQRNQLFEGEYIPDELIEIEELYPTIPKEHQSIIGEFLKLHQESLTGPKLIKTIY